MNRAQRFWASLGGAVLAATLVALALWPRPEAPSVGGVEVVGSERGGRGRAYTPVFSSDGTALAWRDNLPDGRIDAVVRSIHGTQRFPGPGSTHAVLHIEWIDAETLLALVERGGETRVARWQDGAWSWAGDEAKLALREPVLSWSTTSRRRSRPVALPNGQRVRLAATSDDLWQLERDPGTGTWRPWVTDLEGLTDVRAPSLSPDGRFVAVVPAGEDGLGFVDLTDGRLYRVDTPLADPADPSFDPARGHRRVTYTGFIDDPATRTVGVLSLEGRLPGWGPQDDGS